MQVRSVRKQMELQMRNTKTKLPKGIRKSEQKLTKMMVFIFGTFLLTYMPGVVVKMVRFDNSLISSARGNPAVQVVPLTFELKLDEDLNKPGLHVMFYVLNWISVVMNPVIYFFTQERYRDAFRYRAHKRSKIQMTNSIPISYYVRYLFCGTIAARRTTLTMQSTRRDDRESTVSRSEP